MTSYRQSEVGTDPFSIRVDGLDVEAQAGDTVAAALFRAGVRVMHWSAGRPRGLFCGIGSCYDCYSTINGYPYQRTCITLAEPGMQVETRE